MEQSGATRVSHLLANNRVPTMQVRRRILSRCVYVVIVSALLSNAGIAETRIQACTVSTTSNPVILLLHKPSRLLHVIKSGRKIRKITLKDNPRIDAFPPGVYTILDESGNPKYARFSFAAPDALAPKTTWSGHALVAEGDLVKLQSLAGIPIPQKFIRELLDLTKPGAVLVVADSHSTLGKFEDVALFEDQDLAPAKQSTCVKSQKKWQPNVIKAPDMPASILISEQDARVYLYEGGRVQSTYRAEIRYPHVDTGRHVYVAIKPFAKSNERQWLAISLAGGGFIQAPPVHRAQHVLKRFSFDSDAQSAIDSYFDRSVVLVVAERGVVSQRRDQDFITLLASE